MSDAGVFFGPIHYPYKYGLVIDDNDPLFIAFVYSFDPTVPYYEELYFSWIPPTDFNPDEDVEISLIWAVNGTWVAGSYNWTISYILKSPSDFTNTGTNTTMWENVTPSNKNQFIETNFTQKITGLSNDNMLFLRFHLNTDGSTTATEYVHVVYIKLKYCSNKLGKIGFS